MGSWLEFISDTSLRGKVFWIGASNRPDLIEEAMKRPGRFVEIIPFLYPQTVEERVLIFKAIQRKYNFKTSVKDFSDIASQKLFDIFGNELESNGADIEQIFRKAFEIAQDQGREVIKKEDLELALENHIPKHGDKVDDMTLAAIQELYRTQKQLYASQEDLKQKTEEIYALKAQLKETKAQLSELSTAVQMILAKQNEPKTKSDKFAVNR